MTELYLVNENGQMEMNFDALECVTNPQFATFIKSLIANGHVLKKAEYSYGKTTITMTARQGAVLCIYKFDSSNPIRENHTADYYNLTDLQNMMNYLGGAK